MRVFLNDESDLTLEGLHEEGFAVLSEEDLEFSALEMFATSLGLCTAAVLLQYGETIGVGTEELAVRVRWEYVENPYRVGDIHMEITWPGLPEKRRQAAQRAAAACTIHNTLHHPPDVTTVLAPD